MFNGEESVRIPDRGGDDQTFEYIEENLDGLGRVRISDRGRIGISPRASFENALSKTLMQGTARKRKNGEYEVVITYTCTFNTLGWVIFSIRILLFLIGLLVILAPMMQKSEVSRRISRSLQELE